MLTYVRADHKKKCRGAKLVDKEQYTFFFVVGVSACEQMLTMKYYDPTEKDKLLQYLFENRNALIRVLTCLGFYGMRETRNGYLRCALPDGENVTSVAIDVRTDWGKPLFCHVYSRRFKGDFYALMQLVKPRWNFRKCVRQIKKYINLDQTIIDEFEYNRPTSTQKEVIDYTLTPIDPLPSYFTKSETPIGEKYDIRLLRIDGHVNLERYHYLSMVIPHFSFKDKNVLVGYNSRFLSSWDEFSDTSLRCIEVGMYDSPFPSKYTLLPGYKRGLNLYGYSHNKEWIKQKKVIVVFEGEKSVWQLDRFYDMQSNGVAVGSNNLTSRQVEIVSFIAKGIKGLEIILAFDNDLNEIDYIDICCEFYESGAQNISYIIDREEILGAKDAPVDKGREVWERLYNNRVRFEPGMELLHG